MKWVDKIRNAKMIAFSQFPIGAEFNIVVTPQSVLFLDTEQFSGAMLDRYLGMNVRIYIPEETEMGIPPAMITSEAAPCLGVAIAWDGTIIVRECDN